MKIKAILILSALIFTGTAEASVYAREYSHLTTVKDQKVCLYLIHRYDAKGDLGDPTNVKEAIQCRMRLWPMIEGKEETLSVDTDGVYNIEWMNFPLDKMTEACFDFESKLAKKANISGVARFNMVCSSESDSEKYFSEYSDRPSNSKPGLIVRIKTWLDTLFGA